MSRKKENKSSIVNPTVESPQLPSCKTCRFWYHIREGLGNCRRFPPTIPSPSLTSHGPPLIRGVVSQDEWCGEYSSPSSSPIPSSHQVKSSNE